MMKILSRRSPLSLFLVVLLGWIFTSTGQAAGAPIPSIDHSKGIQFQRQPIRFEVNEGQTDRQVRFTARDRDGITYLTSDGAVFQVVRSTGGRTAKPGLNKTTTPHEPPAFESSFVRMKTVGANPNPRALGVDRLPGVTNYFIGNDPKKWRSNVAGFARVKYENVYPGIDLVYYASAEGHLEYDFIVAPGADPKLIALSLEGSRSVEIDASGDLVIDTATGTIRKPAPKVYQEIDGKRQMVASGYRLIQGDDASGTQHASLDARLAFALGAYDPTLPLVIDPQVIYATYLGGSSTSAVANEGATGVAVDAQGSVYVTGVAISADFPLKDPIQNTLKSFTDAYITKLDANGQLVYSTYLGGNGFDFGEVIKVDDTGAAYVGGNTGSTDFPTVNPIQGTYAFNTDAFITKLNPAGSAIVYSTYLGGTDSEGVADLALDAQKNLFVLGNVRPGSDPNFPFNDFPTVNPIQATYGGGFRDGFLSVIDAKGSSLLFSTYLGGDGDDWFQSINLDPSNGDLYLAYFTDSTNFPPGILSTTARSADTQPSLRVGRVKGTDDWFFVIGNEILIIHVDENSPDKRVVSFPLSYYSSLTYIFTTGRLPTAPKPDVLNPVQTQALGGLDVRLTQLDENLNAVKSAFFGGSREDTPSAGASDSKGAAYVIGRTNSADLPVVDPIQANLAAANAFDGFLAVFAPGTLQPVFATYLGGPGAEDLNGVTVDPQGNIYVVGTAFADFPTATPGAFQSARSGRTDAFIIKISPVEIPDDVLLVSSVLPSSRSVQVGTPATAFATMINAGQSVATSCSVVPTTGIPATFLYQTTNPATNEIIGTANTPIDIAPGQAQSFVIAVTPNAPIAPTDVQFSFDCTNSDPAPVHPGLNTLLFSASDTPVPDIVALAAASAGIVDIPGTTGTGVFAVATVNVGAAGTITASADTGTAILPVNIFLCETDPGTGVCISGIGASVTTTIGADATPTFGIFVQGSGNVPFDPAGNRVFVRFTDGGGVTRGSTSVAVRTQ